jgi:hypothetical protein
MREEVVNRNSIIGVSVGPRSIALTYYIPLTPDPAYDWWYYDDAFRLEFIGQDDMTLLFEDLVCIDFHYQHCSTTRRTKITLMFSVSSGIVQYGDERLDLSRPPLEHLRDDFDGDEDEYVEKKALAFAWWEEGF